MKQEQQFSI